MPLKKFVHAPCFINQLVKLSIAIGLIFVTNLPLQAKPANDNLQERIIHFLAEQTQSLQGQVKLSVRLPAYAIECPNPQPFLPRKNRPIGRITVGVKCPDSRPTIRYFQAYVAVSTTYVVALDNINSGEVISAANLAQKTGDISELSKKLVLDKNKIIGLVATRRIAAGMPLNKRMFKKQTLIKRGNPVQIIYQGSGFEIKTTGIALGQAAKGESITVQTEKGKRIRGRAAAKNQVVVH